MKKIGKVLAVLLALLTVCTAAAASVFATSAADVTAAPASDTLAGVEMVDCDLSEYGVRITVPKMANFLTADSPSNEGLETLGANASDIMEENFLLYDISADNTSAVYIQYRVTPYTKSVGSFNKLNAEELANEIAAFDFKYGSGSSFGELDSPAADKKMGGSTVLHASFKAQTTNPGDTITDVIYTIQNGVAYTIVCRLTGTDTDEGIQRHDQVMDSVRFSAPSLGYAFEGNIAKNSYGINIFLLIASIILLILAALLFFFFYRFSAFQKAADSSFNVFGFDMPYPSDHDDKSYSDEDGDGFDDAHDFN